MKALPPLLLGILLSCGQAMNRNANQLAAPGTFLITAEEIEKSGASTAWQVLRQHAPMLTMREDGNGRPQSMGRRGRSSFLLDEAPMILLDGVRVPDFHALDTIEAHAILTILIYDGVEGTTYYGTDAVSGVIVIKTKDGRQS
jgi:outer membrane cobalamin receptor